jgi:hypothetical protein
LHPKGVTALRRLVAHGHVWLKLAVLLVLFALWVNRVFVPGWLAARYREPYPMLAPHTVDVGVLFDLLPPPAPAGDVVVVLVGDSSVGGFVQLAPALERNLAALLPGRRVRVIDFTVVGMYAPDALLFIAKAFSIQPDMVVYAMSPRIVPTAPANPWATMVSDLALQPDIVARIGLGTAVALVGPTALGRVAVYSWWSPARLRVELASAALEGAAEYLPPAWTVQLARLVPRLPRVQPIERRSQREPYLWPRAKYQIDPPTRSTRALDDIIGLCGRERRCLLYHVPVNPRGTQGFEPGLLDAFVAHVEARADAAGVSFFDHRGAADPQYYLPDAQGRIDPLHPIALGHAAFAPRLAREVADRIQALPR